MVVGVLVFTDMVGMTGAEVSVEEIQPNYILSCYKLYEEHCQEYVTRIISQHRPMSQIMKRAIAATGNWTLTQFHC